MLPKPGRAPIMQSREESGRERPERPVVEVAADRCQHLRVHHALAVDPGLDWAALRAACIRDARARGASVEDAEDAAQEAIARTLEAGSAVKHPRTYARRCAVSQGVQQLSAPSGEPVDVDGLPLVEPEQEAAVEAAQLVFAARVAGVTVLGVQRSMGVGDAARSARRRLKAMVATYYGWHGQEACHPPGLRVAGPEGEGTPNDGRGLCKNYRVKPDTSQD